MKIKRSAVRMAVPVFFVFTLFCSSAWTQDNQTGASALAPQNTAPDIRSLQTYAQAYESRDTELQSLIIAHERALLSHKKTVIENGVSLNVSTGKLGAEISEDGTELSASPSVSVSVPSLGGASVKAELPVTVKNDSWEFDSAGISLSKEIVSSTKKDRQAALEKSERSVLEADRKVQARRKTVYKNFLSAVRLIASYELAAAEALDTLIEEQLAFDEIKVKGYSESSSKYRTAQLEVRKAEQDLEKQERLSSAAAADLHHDCGFEYDEKQPSFFSIDVPEVQLADTAAFDSELYIDIESARWTLYINSLDRAADPAFTLSAEGGYGFTKQDASGTASSDKENHSLDTALVFSVKGLELTAGVSVPFKTLDGWGFSKPSFSLSAGWNTQTAKKEQITNQDKKLAEQSELIAIETAFNAYRTDIEEKETEYRDLLWKKENYQKNFALYSELAADTAKWFEKGLVTATENRQAQSHYETAWLQVYLTKIDFMLFNAECALLFLDSTETKGLEK